MTITLAVIGLLGTLGVAWLGVRKATSSAPESTTPARRRQLESGTTDQDEEQELDELRNTLIDVLQQLQKEKQRAAEAVRQAALLEAQVERLQATIDALIERRRG